MIIDVTNFNAKRDFQGSRETMCLIKRRRWIHATTLEYTVAMEMRRRGCARGRGMNLQDTQQNRIYCEPRWHEENFPHAHDALGAHMDDKAFAEVGGPDPATKCYVIRLPGVEG